MDYVGTVIGAKGAGGHVPFDGTAAQVTRDGPCGFMSSSGITGREFHVSQIAAADFQPGTRRLDYLRPRRSSGYDPAQCGALKRQNNPTSVSFSHKQRTFKALYSAVAEAITRFHSRPRAASSAHAPDLAQLEQLFHNSLLTGAEHQPRRTQIINSL